MKKTATAEKTATAKKTAKKTATAKKTDMLFKEYQLAIETQMHFNDILMKFRSFAVIAVVALYSYALSLAGPHNPMKGFALPEGIALAGVAAASLFAIVDMLYFSPLLTGAVKRSIAIEGLSSNAFGLTSAISQEVSSTRALHLILAFYILLVFVGIFLTGYILV